ncbi:MAG: response regulator [Thermodesulfobacteriota bacterium]
MTPKKKILVVDDEKDVLSYLTALFEDAGYATLTAETGSQCMEKAKAEKPDLITLDITMPEQSGVRAYRKLREDAELAKIPVIIVTAIGEEMEMFLAKLKGFAKPDGFMNKPIVPDELIAMAKKVLSR